MKRCLKEESGLTLVESLMAMLILVGGLLLMAEVLTLSVIASKTHGRDSGKATAFARAKMEELAGLPFNSAELEENTYSEYLTVDGNTGEGDSAAYVRQWEIIDDDPGSLKRVIVTVSGSRSFQYGTPPSTVLVTQMAPE